MLESEFVKGLEEIFGKGSPYSDFSIQLENYSPKEGRVTIRISRMYDYVDVQFDELVKLSDFAQTRKINLGNKTSYSGCGTCDYGSSYEVPIHLEEFWIPLEKSSKQKKRQRHGKKI
jgi:hypothetical protein